MQLFLASSYFFLLLFQLLHEGPQLWQHRFYFICHISLTCWVLSSFPISSGPFLLPILLALEWDLLANSSPFVEGAYGLRFFSWWNFFYGNLCSRASSCWQQCCLPWLGSVSSLASRTIIRGSDSSISNLTKYNTWRIQNGKRNVDIFIHVLPRRVRQNYHIPLK